MVVCGGSGTHSGYYNIEEEIFEACYAALPDLHTSALDDKILPKNFQLFGNYPNPFNNSTTIMYEIDESGQVQLELFNLLGQKLSTLVSTRQLPGIYQIDWDASDFPSGIYLYRLRLNSDRLHKTQTNKLLLQK